MSTTTIKIKAPAMPEPDWNDVSEDARDWLGTLGGFGPTVHAEQRELKGYLHCSDGGDGRTYFDSDDLRKIAAACIEAAEWLDKRAANEERQEPHNDEDPWLSGDDMMGSSG